MPFQRPLHHSSRHFRSPNINHSISGFCSVSSWGTESSSVWLIFNSTTAVLFFPNPPTPLTESLMPVLVLWRVLQHQARCTDTTALSTHWNEPPKQVCVYRHNAVGPESQGRAWKHCTNSCGSIPQGYMQSHIHSGFFACKWFMGTRMLLYCLFKTHCNSSGYFIENQHQKDMAKPQANSISSWWWKGMALRRLKSMPIPTELM